MINKILKAKQELDEAYELWSECVEKFAKKPTEKTKKQFRYLTLDLNAKKNKVSCYIYDYYVGGDSDDL